MEFVNTDGVNAFHKEGKNMATVVGHMGNWEWSSVFSHICDYDCVVIYKPLANKIFDQLMFRLRARHGFRPVAMQHVIREYILAKNEKRCINAFFIADQSPMKNEIHYWTEFLNQETPVFTGTEKIARKFNSVVVFVYVTKPARGQYRLEFIPVSEGDSQDDSLSITEKHVRLLEKNIREQPEIWLWSHRRWKHKKNSDPTDPIRA
jgi:KDO2-lipid IV(A) lauroyltransferase